MKPITQVITRGCRCVCVCVCVCVRERERERERERVHAKDVVKPMSYEEEDTCMPYEEKHTCKR
jgi:hypothetical protein